MPGRVSSLYGSRPGTGADKSYVPLNQTTCCFLSFLEDRSGVLFARFIRFCYGVCGEWPWGFWALLRVLLTLALLFYTPMRVWDLGYAGVPIAGHVLWAEVDGGTVRCSVGVHRITGKCASRDIRFWDSRYYCLILQYVLAFVRLPSLHGYHACMVNRAKGALRGNCRLKHGKTFFPFMVFLLC